MKQPETAFGSDLPDFVRRLPVSLTPDPSMVVLRPFRPAVEPRNDNPLDKNRIERIVSRVVSMPAAEVKRSLAHVMTGFADRHVDVQAFFLKSYRNIAEPYLNDMLITFDEQLLVGAYFSHEYSFQAAALFNPSIVAHPDQSEVEEGGLRFVMSLRAVGEGHISSICFRTGIITAGGDMVFDEPHDHSMIAAANHVEADPDGLEDVMLTCDEAPTVDATVIFPTTPAQSNGLEDLRLLEFEGDEGGPLYYGTYTAYSGRAIRSEMMETRDFKNFRLFPLAGDASVNKGMGLFPRKLDGRYAMIGRQDNENLWLLYSEDLRTWNGGELLLQPKYDWEFVQIGNCGCPIEIEEGWLVLLHGVGAVRNYSIGAALLDKKTPSKVLKRTARPLVAPTISEREGYVPNVVYSCGGIVHQRTLYLPYAIADSVTSAVAVELDDLLDFMQPV